MDITDQHSMKSYGYSAGGAPYNDLSREAPHERGIFTAQASGI